MTPAGGSDAADLASGAAADVGLLSPMWAGTPVATLTGDLAFTQAMLDVELAWVEVLAEAGLAPSEVVASVAAATDAASYDLTSLAARSAGGGNPLIPLLSDLRGKVSTHSTSTHGTSTHDAAAVIHRGATSQDVADTALMLLASRAVAVIGQDLRTAGAALAELAEQHRETLCVARTLTQHSLPSTFGLRAARWLSGVAQAAESLHRLADELPLQWGGAAGTMAAVTELTRQTPATDQPNQTGHLTGRLAARLGLTDPGVPWQTNPIPVTTLGQALAEATSAAGRIANDVLVLVRPEIGELGEPKVAGRGGSSAMPQKQNPVLSVLIRSAALSVPGPLAQLQLAASSGVDERSDGAWQVQWQALRQALRLAGGSAAKLAELTQGLVVHPERMRANLALSGPLVVSERIMAVLAPLLDDSPRPADRSGKQQVQELIDTHLADPSKDLYGLLRQAVPADRLDDAALEALLDPANYLGAGDQLIDTVLNRHRDWLGGH